MQKTYITAQQLLDDSLELAALVLDSGFRPDLIIGIWRGGTPVGIALQEVLAFAGLKSDHFAIRTASYTGIGERSEIVIDGLEYVTRQLTEQPNILLVDDVYDTGLSLQAVKSELLRLSGELQPEIRLATPWYKPGNNQTGIVPDYHLHATDDWLVFPHELIGLSATEIRDSKPGIDPVRERLLRYAGGFAGQQKAGQASSD